MSEKIAFDPAKMKSQPSESDKQIAKKFAALFGGSPKFLRKFNRDESFYVDVMSSANSPDAGLTSYCTIGLSNNEMHLPDGQPFLDTRLELVACVRSQYHRFDNILYQIAELVYRTGLLCAPGVFLYDILKDAGYSGDMRHIVFEEPFVWPELDTVKYPDKTVSWLMTLPVSEAELQYARKNSVAELGEKIDEAGVDIFDLMRHSIF
jgi:antitoxin YqcF